MLADGRWKSFHLLAGGGVWLKRTYLNAEELDPWSPEALSPAETVRCVHVGSDL